MISNKTEIVQLFFCDSSYSAQYKKLCGIFSSKEIAVSHLDEILKANNINLSHDNIEVLKKYLIENNQIEIEHDWCLLFDEVTLDQIENIYY